MPLQVTRRELLSPPGRMLKKLAIAASEPFLVVETSSEAKPPIAQETPVDEAVRLYMTTAKSLDFQMSPGGGSLLPRLLALGGIATLFGAGYYFLSNLDKFTQAPTYPNLEFFPATSATTIEEMVKRHPMLQPKTAQELLLTMQALDAVDQQFRLPGTAPVGRSRNEIVILGPQPVSVSTDTGVMVASDMGRGQLTAQELQRLAGVYSSGSVERRNGNQPEFVAPNAQLRLEEALRRGRKVPGLDGIWEVGYKGTTRLVSEQVSLAALSALPEAVKLLADGFSDNGITSPDRVIAVGSGATGHLAVRLDSQGKPVELLSDFVELMHLYEAEGVEAHDEFLETYHRMVEALNNGGFDTTLNEVRRLYQDRIMSQTGQRTPIQLPDEVGHQAIMRTIYQPGAGIVKLVRWLEFR